MASLPGPGPRRGRLPRVGHPRHRAGEPRAGPGARGLARARVSRDRRWRGAGRQAASARRGAARCAWPSSGAGIAGLAAASRPVRAGARAGAGARGDRLRGRRAGRRPRRDRGDDDGFVVEGGPDCFVSQKPCGHAAGARARARASGADLARCPQTFVLSRRPAAPAARGRHADGAHQVPPAGAEPAAHLAGQGAHGAGPGAAAAADGADESLGGFVRRRLGDEALDKIAEPLVAGVHAGDPDRLSLLQHLPALRHGDRGPLADRGHGAGPGAPARGAGRRAAGGPPAPPTGFVTLAGGLGGAGGGAASTRLPPGGLRLDAPVVTGSQARRRPRGRRGRTVVAARRATAGRWRTPTR